MILINIDSQPELIMGL